MSKQKFVLLGPEIGASGTPVTKELATFQGDALDLEGGFVRVIEYGAANLAVAYIRLAEGQSIKRAE